MQFAASNQDLHCLPFLQQFLDRRAAIKMDEFKFLSKYAEMFTCPTSAGKYGIYFNIGVPGRFCFFVYIFS